MALLKNNLRRCMTCFFLICLQSIAAKNILPGKYNNVNVDLYYEEQIQELIKHILLADIYNSDCIIHVDSSSVDFIQNAMINVASTNRTKKIQFGRPDRSAGYFRGMIVNYDTLESPLSSFENRTKYYYINMIFLKNISKFNEYNRKLITYEDTAIFFCYREFGMCENEFDANNRLKTTMLKDAPFLKVMYNTLVMEISDERIALYEVCYYCGTNVNQLNILYENTLDNSMETMNENITVIILERTDDCFINLHQHVFYIGVPLADDSFTCKNPRHLGPNRNGTEIICEDIRSVEGKMLEEMSENLNITYKFINYDDYDYGKVVNYVNKGVIDWAVGSITVTTKRHELVRFSNTVGEDPTKILYSVSKGVLSNANQLIKVFTPTTWILLFVTIFFQSIIVFLYNTYFSDKTFTSYAEISWTVGLYLVDQPMAGKIKTICKPTIAFWLICCININTLYKAKLTSFQTMPIRDELKNLDTLVKEGYSAYLIEDDSTFISETINGSSDASLQKLQGRTVVKPEMCQVIEDLSGVNMMLITEMAFLHRDINTKCIEILSRDDLVDLRINDGGDIFPSWHAWPFNHKTPYIFKINTLIRYYDQYGIFLKWYRDSKETIYNRTVYYDGKEIVIKDRKIISKHLHGLFILYLLGMTLAFFCLLTEIICFKYIRRKDSKGVGRKNVKKCNLLKLCPHRVG